LGRAQDTQNILARISASQRAINEADERRIADLRTALDGLQQSIDTRLWTLQQENGNLRLQVTRALDRILREAQQMRESVRAVEAAASAPAGAALSRVRWI
jgi:hypothetical protein